MQLLSFAVLAALALAPLVRCTTTPQPSHPQPPAQVNKNKLPLLNVHPNITVVRHLWSSIIQKNSDVRNAFLVPETNSSSVAIADASEYNKFIKEGTLEPNLEDILEKAPSYDMSLFQLLNKNAWNSVKINDKDLKDLGDGKGFTTKTVYDKSISAIIIAFEEEESFPKSIKVNHTVQNSTPLTFALAGAKGYYYKANDGSVSQFYYAIYYKKGWPIKTMVIFGVILSLVIVVAVLCLRRNNKNDDDEEGDAEEEDIEAIRRKKNLGTSGRTAFIKNEAKT